MKRKIAILGSTGSIGKTLLNLISKEKKNFWSATFDSEQRLQNFIIPSKKI